MFRSKDQEVKMIFSSSQDFVKSKISICVVWIFLFLSSVSVEGGNSPSTFTYQGKLTNAAGTSALLDTVTIKIGIYNPAGTCLLYEESQSADTSTTGGVFSIEVGQSSTTGGKRTASDPNLSMVTVFANTSSQIRAAGANCAGGYTPSTGDTRSLRFTVTPTSTGVTNTLSPDQVLNSVPHAIVAQTLQGYGPASFIFNTGNVTQTNLDTLTGAGDASALHTHDTRYVQIGSAASLGSNSYVSGNFGIGTSSPSFDLGFGGNSSRTIGINRNSTTSGSDLTVSSGGALSGGTNLSGGTLALSSGTATGTGSSAIEFKTATAGGSGTTDNAPTTKMTVLGNGNVGIGTTSPNFPLEVNGDIRTSGKVYINRGDGNNSFIDGSGNNLRLSSVGGAGSIVFATTNSTTERMRIDGATGNVGIGTTNPTFKLDVNNGTSYNALKISAGNNSGTDGLMRLSHFSTGQNHDVSWDQNDLKFTPYRNTIFSAGNIGLGTTSPLAKLHVNDGVNINLLLGSQGGTAGIKSVNDANSSRQGFVLDSSKSYFQINGTNQMVLDGTGLGIGTTTPGGPLDVQGSSASMITRTTSAGSGQLSAVQVGISGNSAVTGTGSSLLFFADNTAAVKQFIGRISSIWETATAGSESSAMTFNVRPNNADTNATTEAMRITSTSRVGIGTTAPIGRLHVSSGVSVIATADTAADDAVFESLGDTGISFLTAGTNKSSIYFGKAGANNSDGRIVYDNNNRKLSLWTAQTQNLTIDTNGNVGIGTVGPAAKLQIDKTVVGDIPLRLNSPAAVDNVLWDFQIGTVVAGTHPKSLTISGSSGGSDFIVSPSTTALGALVIKGSGATGIGNTAPGSLLHVGNASTSAGLTVAQFQTATGTCTMTPATSGTGIACSSDERLKRNIREVSGEFALEKLLQLQAVTYEFKKDPKSERHTGYIAQQLMQFAPEFVRQGQDGYYQVYYDGFIPWITEAIKQLYVKVARAEDLQAHFRDALVEKEKRIQLLEEQNKSQSRGLVEIRIENEKLKQENDANAKILGDLLRRINKIESSKN